MQTKAVEFNSEGVSLRGEMCVPDGEGPFPAVVMAGGWLYVKEFNLPAYAEAFAAKGIASLRFDYRGFGASDGAPRQHVDPWGQIADLRNGLSFLENLAEVDPNRLGIWGISFGGGHALIVGSVDSRVRCVVSNVPVCDGYEGIQRLQGTRRFRAFKQAILEDRRKRFLTGEYGYMAFASEDELSQVPLNEVRDVFLKLKETIAPNIEMHQTIASCEALLEYTVFPHIERLVETPVLMIVAEGDDVTWVDLETKAYNQIPSPRKRLLTLPGGVTHSSLYRDRSPIEISSGWAADWLVAHLKGDGIAVQKKLAGL